MLLAALIMIRLLPLLLIGLAIYFLLKPEQRALIRRSLKPLAALLFALVYLPLPIDLIPDVAPIGFLDDLLVLIAAIWWARQQFNRMRQKPGYKRQAGPTQTEPPPQGWDPYEVLGVGRNASPDEITRAYREQLKRYHPDRVADLGEDLQKVAHEKTIELRRAYEQLRTL